MERTLDIVNIGDSGAVVVGGQPAHVMPNKKRVIVVATFSQDEKVEIDVNTSETLRERYNGVNCFIALSDGVASNLEKLLYRLDDSLKSMSIDEARRRLLSRVDLTYDDRAVIIGRLMQE